MTAPKHVDPQRFSTKGIDLNIDARKLWLDAMQTEIQLRSQSDFEHSAVWHGIFIAAFIVILINIHAAPPPVQTHISVRATV